MVELSCKYVLSNMHTVIFAITFLVFAMLLAVGICFIVFEDAPEIGRVLIGFAIVASVAAIIELAVLPRNNKEIECYFTGTVDMDEIRAKYIFESVTHDGVFTLLERKKYGGK